MHTRTVLGIVLLVGGIVALVVGLVASDSIADQVSQTFFGRFTRATTWYIVGGIAAAAGGLVLLGLNAMGRMVR